MKAFLIAVLLVFTALISPRAAAADPAPPKAAKTELEGEWRALSIVNGDDRVAPAQLAQLVFSFRGDRHTLTITTEGVHKSGARLHVDPTKAPKEFDLDLDDKPATEKQPRVFGIYKLEGERLTLAFNRKSPKERLKAFPASSEEGVEVVTLAKVSE